jgi:acyl carrier protein
VNPDTNEPMPPDRVGEIWAKGSTITLGYYGKPELTKAVFHVSRVGGTDPVWLRTGDLGFIHDGELFITGRLKDLIIIHGRNFYPQDIELTVEESHSSIRKTFTAAFSIEEKGTEKLAVVAELKRSILPHDTEKIMDAIVGAISQEYEIQPARVILAKIGSIPKTSSGKTMRKATREHLHNGKFEIIAQRSLQDETPLEVELPFTDLETFLYSWISRNMNKGLPVDPDLFISNYGLDSLKAVELATETKKLFGFEWPPYLFFEEMPLRQLVGEGKRLLQETEE